MCGFHAAKMPSRVWVLKVHCHDKFYLWGLQRGQRRDWPVKARADVDLFRVPAYRQLPQSCAMQTESQAEPVFDAIALAW